MMADPWRDGHFELAGVRWSGTFDQRIGYGAFDPGTVEVRAQDVPNPVGHGTLMGRDFLTGPTWGFDLDVQGDTRAEYEDAVSRLATAWRSGAVLKPGQVLPLTYQAFGRKRRVYGRPRRFTPPTIDWESQEASRGYATADFTCADHLHYDETVRSVTVTLVASSTGGWVFPAVWPIDTIASGTRQGVIDDVGGDAPAPFEIVVKGPVSAVSVAGPGFRLDLPDLELAYDQSVTASTYPWGLTVLRNDGADVSSALSPKSRLAGARLKPGPGEFTFTGVDATNTATCTIWWRPAWHSL